MHSRGLTVYPALPSRCVLIQFGAQRRGYSESATAGLSFFAADTAAATTVDPMHHKRLMMD